MSLIHPRSYPCNTLSRSVNLLANIITRSRSLLFTTIGFGLASMPLLCLGDSGVTLEPPQQFTLAQLPLDGQTIAKNKVLFVNPTVAQKIGNGSERAPFKTITQALQVAQSSSVIVLTSGTYSTSSGEQFPLMLKPGISIQGDPRTRGSKILIQGGGTFLSPTFARQNITILGANQASLTGVTVTNPNPRGYGLWIESTSPVVTNNTFTGSNHDGISMTGNSAPTIRNNYFYQNGANGITIYGTSRPEVRENVFEKTGFGINVAQKAAPVLVGNRITQNRSGIVAQADTRPVLRGNIIEGNTEDGVVAIANSQPDLGTKQEPGGNVFRQNGRYDINSKASRQVVPAFGNQLANAHTAGRVDVAGSSSLVATPAIQRPSITPLALNPVTATTKQELVVSQTQSVQSAQPADMTSMAPIIIPVPPPASSQLPIIPSKPSSRLSSIKITPASNQGSNSSDGSIQPIPTDRDAAIPIPTLVAPPPPQPDDAGQKLPVLQPAQLVVSDLLPVPSANIPIGNPRKLPPVPVIPENSLAPSVGGQPPSMGSQPLPQLQTTAASLHYRVVVEAASQSQQDLVKSLVPGAFRTSSKGRALMQVGAFSDRANADEIQQMLSSKGLTATIEQIR